MNLRSQCFDKPDEEKTMQELAELKSQIIEIEKELSKSAINTGVNNSVFKNPLIRAGATAVGLATLGIYYSYFIPWYSAAYDAVREASCQTTDELRNCGGASKVMDMSLVGLAGFFAPPAALYVGASEYFRSSGLSQPLASFDCAEKVKLLLTELHRINECTEINLNTSAQTFRQALSELHVKIDAFQKVESAKARFNSLR